GLVKSERHGVMQKYVADVVKHRVEAGSILHEGPQADGRALVQPVIQNAVYDVRAIRDSSGCVDLEFRTQQPFLRAVLRREVAKHTRCLEQVLPQFTRVINGAAAPWLGV